MNKHILFNKSGFSLLEIIISVAILGSMSLLVARTIQQGLKNKTKIQEQLDDLSKVRNTLKVIETDISLAFHYRDVEKDLTDAIKKKGQQQPGTTQTPAAPGQPPQPAVPTAPAAEANREVPRRDPATQFMGSEAEVHFVTSNVQRTTTNTRMADFIEVGYFLKDCEGSDSDRFKKCLFRRSSPYVDRDVTKGGEEISLVDNIVEFKLQYIGKGKQDWSKTWKSGQGGDSVTTGNFPQAVEVSLVYEKELPSKRKKKYSMQIVVPIRFTNNKNDYGTAST
ncbi:MAG: type II secretion system protein J, partial [Pseudobdellovibrionaceae bacterium]